MAKDENSTSQQGGAAAADPVPLTPSNWKDFLDFEETVSKKIKCAAVISVIALFMADGGLTWSGHVVGPKKNFFICLFVTLLRYLFALGLVF
ncbi:hypothetical protein LINGRAHAP2_LOCUS7498 [Linum grandiflorum]